MKLLISTSVLADGRPGFNRKAAEKASKQRAAARRKADRHAAAMKTEQGIKDEIAKIKKEAAAKVAKLQVRLAKVKETAKSKAAVKSPVTKRTR